MRVVAGNYGYNQIADRPFYIPCQIVRLEILVCVVGVVVERQCTDITPGRGWGVGGGQS